jgi:hypothetical protein
MSSNEQMIESKTESDLYESSKSGEQRESDSITAVDYLVSQAKL